MKASAHIEDQKKAAHWAAFVGLDTNPEVNKTH